jgi:molybdopterin/thiamine biosynthesis adenylyltransferase
MTSVPLPKVPARARVLVVGMGGLGCPASLALAQAGVGQLVLVDPDRVELSNLHRQPWHRDADVGRLKVDSAAAKLRAAFPSLHVETHALRVGPENVRALLAGADVVVDGTDGVDAKFLLNDAAVRARVPLVHGGVVRHEGLVLAAMPGGPCLRCLFEEVPGEDVLPTCARAGVLGAAAGWVGGLQAAAAEAVLRGESLKGAYWRVDARSGRARRLSFRTRPDCPACGTNGVEAGATP